MATEVKGIDQIIKAMRQWKCDSQWKEGIGRIAELAERVVELEDKNAKLMRQRSDDGWNTCAELAEMTIQRNRGAGRVRHLIEELAEMTKSRDGYQSQSMSSMHEIATLKKKIEDQERKFSRMRITLSGSMPMTDRIAKALEVLCE